MFDRDDYLIAIYSAASAFISEKNNAELLDKLQDAIDAYENSGA